VDLLRRVSLGEEVAVPGAVAVIGGGNTAMDAARTVARLQLVQHGRADVTVTALEDDAHLLADPDEIREALEEGISVLPSRGPQRCVSNDAGGLDGLYTVRVTSVFDADGRFAPCYDDSDVRLHPCGMVIEAIGQQADVSLLGEALTERLAWQRGRLQVDEQGRTSEDGLWAAGDLVHGPDVIHAVADGHRVAASIEQWLGQRAGVNA